jgi:hypothetical protein
MKSMEFNLSDSKDKTEQKESESIVGAFRQNIDRLNHMFDGIMPPYLILGRNPSDENEYRSGVKKFPGPDISYNLDHRFHILESDINFIKKITIAADSKKLKKSLMPYVIKFRRNEITLEELHAVINTPDTLDCTPLMYAAVLGNIEVIPWLLTHEANPSLQINNKNTFQLLDFRLKDKMSTATQKETYKAVLRLCVKQVYKQLFLLRKRCLSSSGYTLPNEILHQIMNYITDGTVDRYKVLAEPNNELMKNELMKYELMKYEPENEALTATLKTAYITSLLLTMFGIQAK